MWIRCNPNPARKEVPDCVIRAIVIATNSSWLDVYDDLCFIGRKNFNMPSANEVWGEYLYRLGFQPFLLPDLCPKCLTVQEFCQRYSKGTYIIGTGSHAIAIVDGDYYDSWDSGNEIPSYFWKVN